jgi:DNA-3-methyladenine glycosylase II
MARVSLKAAIEEVGKRDAALRRLIRTVGPIRHRPPSPYGHFGALARAIVFQQLAGAAARTIFERVLVAVDGELTPEAITKTRDEKLRGAGLSANKLASLRDFSAKVMTGAVDLRENTKRGDEEIIEDLITIRGIGRWTAEMYLMFELRRMDVWPVDDLGVRQGYGLIWKMKTPPLPKALAPLGDKFRPYRSVVARYCWEAVALHRGGA